MAKGVDVSRYQGSIDFHALKDNADFVIIKATDGVGYIDPNFTKNRDGARNVGLGIGFYHFAEPKYTSPIAEADWFSKVVSCQPGEIICLDFEEEYPDPVNWCKTFLDRCASNMGFKPLLYINYALSKAYNWQPVYSAGYPLWLAYWDYNPDAKPPQTPWEVVAIRQYSNKGNVAGMSPVDLDIFWGDMAAFKAYGNPPPPTTTTTTTTTTITTTTSTTTTSATTSLTTLQPLPPFDFFEWLKQLFRKLFPKKKIN